MVFTEVREVLESKAQTGWLWKMVLVLPSLRGVVAACWLVIASKGQRRLCW